MQGQCYIQGDLQNKLLWKANC